MRETSCLWLWMKRVRAMDQPCVSLEESRRGAQIHAQRSMPYACVAATRTTTRWSRTSAAR